MSTGDVEHFFVNLMSAADDIASNRLLPIGLDEALGLRTVFGPVKRAAEAWFADVVGRTDPRDHRILVTPNGRDLPGLRLVGGVFRAAGDEDVIEVEHFGQLLDRDVAGAVGKPAPRPGLLP